MEHNTSFPLEAVFVPAEGVEREGPVGSADGIAVVATSDEGGGFFVENHIPFTTTK